MADNFLDYFSGEQSPRQENRRLDVEWVTLNALREMLGIAVKGENSPTYKDALELGAALLPELFDTDTSVIALGQESLLVREYKQRAEAESLLANRDISPLEIVDRDIEQFSRLMQTPGSRDQIRKRISALHNLRDQLRPKHYTENQLIIRDLFKVERDIPVPPIEGDTYRDFRLPNGRGLRIRMIHPDPPEHSIGADLIYETYWEQKRLARFALVQYKIWDGKKILFSQARNLDKQMDRLKEGVCDKNLCNAFEGSARVNAYRLPFCSAFLRPTDELQSADSRLISSGLHIPICAAFRAIEETSQGGKKIERKRVRSEALSHKVFEELFNFNMIGSKWLTYKEVEQLYKEHKILQPDETIILHAQEFKID